MQQLPLLLITLLFVSNSLFSQELSENDYKTIHKEYVTALKKNERVLKSQKRWLWLTNILNSDSTKSFKFNKWELIGPDYRISNKNDKTIGQGRVTALWVNKNNYENILIGASSSGLWETNNGGIEWKCLTNDVFTGGVTDIAIDSNDPNTIYIVSKIRPNGNLKWHDGYSAGIFKSTSHGESWEKLNISFHPDEFFESIHIAHGNANLIYACSNKNVYKSENAGLNWSPILTINSGSFRDMLLHPSDSLIIYVSGDNALYATHNKGVTWLNIKDSLKSVFENARISIAVNINKPNDLYAFYSKLSNKKWDTTPNKIELSSDKGYSWSVIDSSFLTGVAHTQEIGISPQNEIFAGGLNIKKYSADQNKWLLLSKDNIHDDVQKFVFPDTANSNLVFVANDGGIFKSINGGLKWTCINGNLSINEFYDIAITESKPELMLGGTHDCGSYFRDSLTAWNYVFGGDGGTSVIDQTDPSNMYITCNCQLMLFKNGKYKKSVGMLAEYNSPIETDPIYTNSFYLQEERKPRLNDAPNYFLKKYSFNGESITTEKLDEEWNIAQEIGICFSDPNIIYYSTWAPWSNTILKMTTDGGYSWTNVSTNHLKDICLKAVINGIQVHPYYSKKAWICFGGFEVNEKVFFTEDNGKTWVNISGTNLPNVPTQCISYDYINEIIFLGTDAGLYYKHITDNNWNYATGFPKTIVTSLNINKKTGDLVISTYGRGVWRTKLWEEE